MTEDKIKYMASRFLGWKLPDSFNPDGGISFDKFGNLGTEHQYTREPSGTNLLDAGQATVMVKHMVEGMPDDSAKLRKLLVLCQTRIRAQTSIGLISADPDNEDPQHEFQELLADLDDALGPTGLGSDDTVAALDDNFRELEDLIADAMIAHGPDGHCDGSDVIAAVALKWFNSRRSP